MTKILKESAPFPAQKSQSTYRLVEEDGKHFIEQVRVSVIHAEDIPTDVDPEVRFAEFIAVKQEKSGRRKMAISSEEAFTQHHVHGRSWTDIAGEVGQKGQSLSTRLSSFTSDLANKYMKGADINKMAEDLDMSANHLHQILTQRLELERDRQLEYYENGEVMRSHDRDVAKVVEITNFLNDWESFRYQIVAPIGEEEPELQPGKKVLYSELFYTVELESGQQYRLSDNGVQYASMHGWDPSYIENQIGIAVTSDPIVMIYDMFGNKSNYTKDALEAAAE